MRGATDQSWVSHVGRCALFFLGGGEDKPAMGLPCWLIVSTNNITKRDYGPYLGVTSRGSPTLAIAALSITLLKPILWYICLCGSSWGPNPLDEEAAVKSAIYFFPSGMADHALRLGPYM